MIKKAKIENESSFTLLQMQTKESIQTNALIKFSKSVEILVQEGNSKLLCQRENNTDSQDHEEIYALSHAGRTSKLMILQ